MLNDPIARARECASRIPPGGTLIEVGVWRGANASRILKARPDVHLILIDPWRAPAPSDSYAGSGSSDSKITQKQFDETYKRALHNLSPYKGRFTVHRCTSIEAPADLCADVIFIDGDHSYQGCASDIDRWLSNARVWLGGHDYGKDTFPGVTRAVDSLLPDRVLGADSTWWHRV